MTICFSLLSRQPNVSHHPCLRAGLACLEPLAACGRVVPSNLDIPRTCVSIVSGGAAACPNCGKCIHLRVNYITYVSSSTSSVHLLLGLFTSNSATFIRHFPHFACVFPRCASFLLFFSIPSLSQSYLASLSLVYNFLTFRRDLLRMKPHRYLIKYFDTPKNQVSNNVRADGTWSLCPRRVSPPSCMSMSTVVTKTIDSAYVLGLSRCLTLQTQAPCLARFERGASPRISMEFSSVYFLARCVTVSCGDFFVHAYSSHDGISCNDFDFHVCFEILFI